MPVITYVAVDRGELVGGHAAGTSYQIETKLQGYPRSTRVKRVLDEALDGTPEAYVHAAQHEWDVVADITLLAARPNWREFFSSVIGAERFTIDFTGTIAAPGSAISVWLVSDQIVEPQIGGVAVQYRFRVRELP